MKTFGSRSTSAAGRLAWVACGYRPWIGWHGGSWDFRGNDRYPPDNATPEDAFHPFDEGVVKKHVQGFTHQLDSLPIAGSHSHKDMGSIFIVENGSGGKALHSLYKSATDHPGGVALLSDGLWATSACSASATWAGSRSNGMRWKIWVRPAAASNSPSCTTARRC